ncbi:hypothetical protein LBYZC6_03790 [Lacrimispora brassicae]
MVFCLVQLSFIILLFALPLPYDKCTPLTVDAAALAARLMLTLLPQKSSYPCNTDIVNNLSQIVKHTQAHNVYQPEIMELQKGYGVL